MTTENKTVVYLHSKKLASEAIAIGMLPSGYYTQCIEGSHENKRVRLDLWNTNKNYPQDELPEFTYWLDSSEIENYYIND